ncbi:MAG: hypothetical protein AAGA85_07740, partial [Bacteroidota bacterium]
MMKFDWLGTRACWFLMIILVLASCHDTPSLALDTSIFDFDLPEQAYLSDQLLITWQTDEGGEIDLRYHNSLENRSPLIARLNAKDEQYDWRIPVVNQSFLTITATRTETGEQIARQSIELLTDFSFIDLDGTSVFEAGNPSEIRWRTNLDIPITLLLNQQGSSDLAVIADSVQAELGSVIWPVTLSPGKYGIVVQATNEDFPLALS